MQSYLTIIVYLVFFFALFYFMFFMPEKKRKKQFQTLMGNMKVNNDIVTKGGIVGKIISIEGDMLVIQSGPERTRIKILKSAVSHITEKTTLEKVSDEDTSKK